MASISKRKNVAKTKAGGRAAGARDERRSSGAKPSGTNLDRSGGSAANKSKPVARGNGARST